MIMVGKLQKKMTIPVSAIDNIGLEVGTTYCSNPNGRDRPTCIQLVGPELVHALPRLSVIVVSLVDASMGLERVNISAIEQT